MTVRRVEEEEEEGEKRPAVRKIARKKYIYIVYTPNLGLTIAVFDREKGAGPL